MEVILLQDVKTLGKKGEIVKVNEGYARNFIIPKKLGVEANNKTLNDLRIQKNKEEREEAKRVSDAMELKAKIEEKTVNVSLKTGEGGKIFGSVSTKEIADEAKKQLGLDVDKKKMVLKEGIKSLGFYEIPVRLLDSVS